MTRLLKKVTGSASDEDDDEEVADQVAGSASDKNDDEQVVDKVAGSASDENACMSSRWWIRLQVRQAMRVITRRMICLQRISSILTNPILLRRNCLENVNQFVIPKNSRTKLTLRKRNR